jgi:GTP-binding protein HflX
MSHPDRDAQLEDVEDVLGSLGLDEEGAPPRIEAWNKVDLLGADQRDALFEEAKRRDNVVPISALNGSRLDELRAKMAEALRSGTAVHSIRLGAGEGSRIAWLHARGDVLDQQVDGGEIQLQVRLSSENWERFQALQPA